SIQDRPLREIEVMTLGEAFGCVDAGVRLRQPGAHGIFSLRLDQMWETGGVLCSSSSVLRFLELSLPPPSSLPPDLALNALYSVIYAVLLQSQRSPPPATIPYADSPLTNLMKDGLGGNGRSLLLCCLSPSLTQFMQSLNSLQWVQQWGQIQNNPVANIRTEVERDTGVSGTLGTESCGTSGSLEEESKSGERIGKRRHNERRKKGRRRTPSDGEFQNSIFRLQFAASQYQGLISNAELVLQRILEGTRRTDGEEQPDGYLQELGCDVTPYPEAIGSSCSILEHVRVRNRTLFKGGQRKDSKPEDQPPVFITFFCIQIPRVIPVEVGWDLQLFVGLGSVAVQFGSLHLELGGGCWASISQPGKVD
ncbi:unnamed protein product, partial [Cyprideis torosa]